MLLVAMSLLVVMGATALVVDRLWLDTAQAELSTAAEAAALAAAGRLADDAMLQGNSVSATTLVESRQAAQLAASANLVAGRPVVLDLAPQTDVRFGQVIVHAETGRKRFIQSTHEPKTVVVTAHKNRQRNNPVALLMQQLVRRSAADVIARAEASLDNHIVGLRPVAGVPVPALPIAISRQTTTDGAPGWQQQIEDGQGADRYSFHAASGQVVRGGDGIPEMVLSSRSTASTDPPPNFVLLGFHRQFRFPAVNRQIREGLSAQDLSHDSGQLSLAHLHIDIPGCGTLNPSLTAAFESVIGQGRICLLYDRFSPQGQPDQGPLQITQLVAVRVMSATARTGHAIELVVQPTVLTTRTAVLLDEEPGHTGHPVPQNRYIYKLRLTH